MRDGVVVKPRKLGPAKGNDDEVRMTIRNVSILNKVNDALRIYFHFHILDS